MKNLPERRIRFMRMRIAVLAIAMAAGGIAVVKRAWDLQVRQAPQLRKEAEDQSLRGIPVRAKRGAIFDRTGAPLAVSVEVASAFANPKQLREPPAKLAAQLSPVLGMSRATLVDRLSGDRTFSWLKRRLTPVEAKAVRDLGIVGVHLKTESRRFYPNRELASHVLGFSNIDGRGIEGLELALDEQLRGAAIVVPAVRDPRGKVVFSDPSLEEGAWGSNVVLTLDKTIQHFAERELELAVRTFEAKGGSVVALDPRTFEVLAMANYPTYNPNDPTAAPVASRRNRAIADRVEPGSTIKAFTIAGALTRNPGLIDQRIDCEHGEMRVATYRLHDSHPWGELSPAEILQHSSNIGAAKLGFGMGAPALYRTLRDFGFGATTGVGLPGEASGVLRDPKLWYDVDTATVAFGQGLSVTTLQLATAMAALANEGRLQRPALVKRVETARGEPVAIAERAAPQQVVSPQLARTLTNMLIAVTEDGGTGGEAAIDGIAVAGKTGTAQKSDPVHGGYAEGQWVSSFVGFAPAGAPKIVLAVVIDEPLIAHYGGLVAAPTFRRIMQESLRHLDAVPQRAEWVPPQPAATEHGDG